MRGSPVSSNMEEGELFSSDHSEVLVRSGAVMARAHRDWLMTQNNIVKLREALQIDFFSGFRESCFEFYSRSART